MPVSRTCYVRGSSMVAVVTQWVIHKLLETNPIVCNFYCKCELLCNGLHKFAHFYCKRIIIITVRAFQCLSFLSWLQPV